MFEWDSLGSSPLWSEFIRLFEAQDACDLGDHCDLGRMLETRSC